MGLTKNLSFLGEQESLMTYSMVKKTAVKASTQTITSMAVVTWWWSSLIVVLPPEDADVGWASSRPMPPTAPWKSGSVLKWSRSQGGGEENNPELVSDHQSWVQMTKWSALMKNMRGPSIYSHQLVLS